MVIRRSDSRRRRVVIEEAASQLEQTSSHEEAVVATNGPATETQSRVQREYLPAAHRRHHSKATDWIPKRPTAVAIYLTGLVLVVAGIVGLARLAGDSHAQNIASGISSANAWQTRLTLTGDHSLSVWFSTILLLISSLASLQIHALRQHRSNDYRGTYRVWLLFSGLLMLASVNCILDLDGLARTAFAATGGGKNSAWLIHGLQWIALAAILTRGAIEVRKSPASLAAIVLVWLAYSASMLLRLPGTASLMVQDDGFTAAGLDLISTAGVFIAITLYSRFVYLRANGLVGVSPEVSNPPVSKKTRVPKSKPAESPRPTRVKKSKTRVAPNQPDPVDHKEQESEVTAETKLDQPLSRLRMATRAAKNSDSDFASSVQPKEEIQGEDDAVDFRKLSKSERKKLKKMRQNNSSRRAA